MTKNAGFLVSISNKKYSFRKDNQNRGSKMFIEHNMNKT